MIIDPISIGFAAASTGMGLWQASANNAAERQSYLNAKAQSDANREFAQWQAAFQTRVSDANAQFSYWRDTVNHNQNLGYVQSLRNFELQKEIAQLDVIRDTRVSAGADYARASEALNQQIQEKAMGDAVALQQMRMQALRASSTVRAMATEGRSVDRLIADYARQEGNWSAIQAVNQKLYSRQISRQQAAQVAQYMTRWNSEQEYQKQKYFDPIAPYPPLPTLIQPAGPSMEGGAPPSGPSGLQIGTALMGGAQTFMSTNSQLLAYRQGTAGKKLKIEGTAGKKLKIGG